MTKVTRPAFSDLIFPFYLCEEQKYQSTMDTTQNDSTRLDWILFLVFFVVTVLLLLYADEWFWLGLPFMLTYFAKALRAM